VSREARHARVEFFAESDAWVLTLGSAGPAGLLSVLLAEDVRVGVDAVESGRLVEVAIRRGPAGELDPGALAVLGALVGDDAVRALATADPTGPCPTSLAVTLGIAAAEAGQLARAEMLRASAPSRHVLRELDVILHRHRLGFPLLRRQAHEAAWAVWPTVATLARACLDPRMLVALPPTVRGDLRARLLVLLHLLEEDGADDLRDRVAYRSVRRLADDLAIHRAHRARRPAAGVAPDYAARTAPGMPDGPPMEPASAAPAGGGPAPCFDGGVDVESLTGSLGSWIRLVRPGRVAVTVDGSTAVVTVPLALDAEAGQLARVIARVLDASGSVIAGRPLVHEVQDGLPVGVGRIPLPPDTPPAAVDLVRDVVPAPPRVGLGSLTRLRAVRAGQAAVAAATVGRPDSAAAYWYECAELLRSAGRISDADAATGFAVRVRADRHAGSVVRPAEEWVSPAVASWHGWADAELTLARGQESASAAEFGSTSLERVSVVIDRLSGWDEPARPLAEAHRAAFGLLVPVRGDAMPPTVRDEAEEHLSAALRGYAALGLAADAAACARVLDELRAERS
jgi:hypothetical protein